MAEKQPIETMLLLRKITSTSQTSRFESPWKEDTSGKDDRRGTYSLNDVEVVGVQMRLRLESVAQGHDVVRIDGDD